MTSSQVKRVLEQLGSGLRLLNLSCHPRDVLACCRRISHRYWRCNHSRLHPGKMTDESALFHSFSMQYAVAVNLMCRMLNLDGAVCSTCCVSGTYSPQTVLHSRRWPGYRLTHQRLGMLRLVPMQVFCGRWFAFWCLYVFVHNAALRCDMLYTYLKPSYGLKQVRAVYMPVIYTST